MTELETTSESLMTEIMLYSVVASYVLTSLLFLRFPGLLHRKKQIKFKAVKISHRGGSGEGIENTIENFENAIKSGSEMLEMDCQMTSDGEIVVVHDLELTNVCEVPVRVQVTAYKNLPLYKTRVPVTFEKGFVTEVAPNSDRKIPLLREVFEKFPDVPMNIDVKTRSGEAVNKVVSMIEEFNRDSITVIGSFSDHVSKKCKQMEKENIPQFCSFNKVIKILISFYLGLLPFMSINESFYEVMMPSIGYDKNNSMNAPYHARIIFRILDFILMNRFFIRHLQRRGIRMYVWVLNHEDQFERALSYGVDGIMTDFPSRLTSYVSGRGARFLDGNKLSLQVDKSN